MTILRSGNSKDKANLVKNELGLVLDDASLAINDITFLNSKTIEQKLKAIAGKLTKEIEAIKAKPPELREVYIEKNYDDLFEQLRKQFEEVRGMLLDNTVKEIKTVEQIITPDKTLKKLVKQVQKKVEALYGLAAPLNHRHGVNDILGLTELLTPPLAEAISVADVGNYYISENVEGALQEVGANLTDFTYDTEATILAITGEAGDVAIASDTQYLFIHNGAEWKKTGLRLESVSDDDVIGVFRPSNDSGYSENGVTGKVISNSRLGGYDSAMKIVEPGALRFNFTSSKFEGVLIGTTFKEFLLLTSAEVKDLEKKSDTLDTETDIYGNPYRQPTIMEAVGTFSSPLTFDGNLWD